MIDMPPRQMMEQAADLRVEHSKYDRLADIIEGAALRIFTVTARADQAELARGQAVRERDEARGRAVEFADILRDLVDEQEGPPLLRHMERWQGVMNRAVAALAAYAAATGKEQPG